MSYPITFSPNKQEIPSFSPKPSTTNPFSGNDGVGSLYVPDCENNQYQTQRLITTSI
jgi:hypothetical protein